MMDDFWIGDVRWNNTLCRRWKYKLPGEDVWYFIQEKPITNTRVIIEYFSDSSFQKVSEVPTDVRLIKVGFENELIIPLIFDSKDYEYELIHGKQPLSKYFKPGELNPTWNEVDSFLTINLC